MKMNTRLHRSALSILFISVACCLLLTAAAIAQQEEKQPAENKATTAGSAATIPASEPASGSPPIVLPITGKGTINYIPVFTSNTKIGNSIVSQTGNGITVNGTVGAVSFTGSGSALTSVNASTLDGLSSSSFAQTGASNVFTMDQTINGNLNVTGAIDSALVLQGNLTDSNGQQSANVIGGFAGNAAFGANTIAPGVIGATIGGGGGAYDPSVLPARAARNLPTFRSLLGPQNQPSPILKTITSRKETTQNAERNEEMLPPGGVTSGANVVGQGANWATIGGGVQNSVTVQVGTVGGGYNNTASGSYSTVGGGDSNSTNASQATIAGGTGNIASDINSTVGGGFYNTASGNQDGDGGATVAGGNENTASADFATVGGGSGNLSNGAYATVPGGVSNGASGVASFAAGCGARAGSDGSFVWAAVDSETFCFIGNYVSDTGPGQFVAQSPGGFYFYTSTGGSSGSGALLPSGSGSWSSLSDRNAKTNFFAVNPSALLQKLASMPVATWNYKTQADSIRHLGPTAQDFHDAFGLGEDDTHISTVDAEGVALAGIQALYAELKLSLAEKDREISDLRERLARLEDSAEKH